MPQSILNFVRVYGSPRNFFTSLSFFREKIHDVDGPTRRLIVRKLYQTGAQLESPHSFDEMLRVIVTVLNARHGPLGAVVQAGCREGSSTAMLSLAAAMSDRPLLVFDPFGGGSAEEIKANVKKHGDLFKCRFIPGRYEDTLSGLNEKVAVAYLDVDDVASTRTCLKHIYPLLEPGGHLYSQGGYLPPVLQVFKDDEFWSKEVGCRRPALQFSREKRLIHVVKPA